MPEEEDLTADDSLVEQTDKVFPEDDSLPAPSQDPNYIPPTVVDVNGNPA